MAEQKLRILIVDDEEPIRKLLSGRFTREGWHVIAVEDGNQALDSAKNAEFNAIVSDIKMPGLDGFQLLEAFAEHELTMPVVLITGHGEKESAIQAIHKGAFDYLEKPFDMDQITVIMKRALERNQLQRLNKRLVKELQEANSKLEQKLEVTTTLLDRTVLEQEGDLLVGESDAIKNLKNTVQSIAESFRGADDPVVLITGESGVGKEVVARYIHERTFSLRNLKGTKETTPFVAINCAAFPENLLESELFGYEKGAFTGALNRKLGLFELAQNGTLFLDEIGDMDLRMQVKLLRVLQERVIRRLGGTQDISVNAHIVAATNKDLASCVQNKTFREDLYYRLNTLPLVIPPLRSRPDDIESLANHFLKKLSMGRGRHFKGFSQSASRALQNYKWPGNVRELRSIIERAVILEKGPTLELPQLRQESLKLTPSDAPNALSIAPMDAQPTEGATIHSLHGNAQEDVDPDKSLSDLRKDADEQYVRNLLMHYLVKEQGNVSAVARVLKIDRANLLRLFRRYNIDPDLFRKKAA